MSTSGMIGAVPRIEGSAPQASITAPQAPALDLHEGIVEHPRPRSGCERWPERLRLVGSDGRLVPGRCRATNLCDYCRTLYTVETVEMLTLDAMEYAPVGWLVLTAREHLTRAECRPHLDQLRKALRKRWPGVEWFCAVEFQRRGALHLNLVLKGVPVDRVVCEPWRAWLVHARGRAPRECGECVRCVASALWCARVDAEAPGQWGGNVRDGVGVMRYVTKMLAHGLKGEQAPPLGWKGHRTSQTRGYLVRPAWKLRREARAALALKRALWAVERDGLAGADALEVAQAIVARDELVTWELGVLVVDEGTGEITGVRPALGAGRHEHVFRTRALRRRFVEVAQRAEYAELRRWRCVPPPASRSRQLALFQLRRD